MQRITLHDFEDPRLVDYRNLKDAALSASRGRFIVEGRGTLEVLLTRSHYQPESILLSERTYKALNAEWTEFEPDCPVYVGDRQLLDRVVGFPIHRGCLAVCQREQLLDPLDLARLVQSREKAPRVIVLEGLSNLDNVGLIFRNAMALGARAIFLCPRSCDPLYRKAIRTSMGGTLCVPFARVNDLPKFLAGLRESGFQVLAFDPGDASDELESLDTRRLGAIALLFGTEGPGLSDEALAASDRSVRIDMETGVDSLNVGVAAGIGLSVLRASKARDSQEEIGS